MAENLGSKCTDSDRDSMPIYHFGWRKPMPQIVCEQFEKREYEIQAPILFESVIGLNAQKVLELGTRYGDSARIFVEALKLTGGRMWSIDNQLVQSHIANLKPYCIPIHADDLEYPWEEMVDILYIDTSHQYDHTIKELDKYFPFVKNPGLIILHDADCTRGVKMALNDWCEARKIGYILDTRSHGLGFIPKPVWCNRRSEYEEHQKAHSWNIPF